MSEWTLYYNPKCGSCRKALELLRARKVEPAIIEYLKTPPSPREIDEIITRTGGDPHAIVRAKEEAYEAAGLGPDSTRRQIVDAIVKHPILLQRPIVVRGSRAVVARPPEKAADLF